MNLLFLAISQTALAAIKRLVLLVTVLLYGIATKAQSLSFTASVVNDKVSLVWSNSQDQNLNYYSIERSYDNKNFKQVAMFFPQEDNTTTVNYTYKDPVKKAAAAVIYYRLKLVDRNGKFKCSSIIPVHPGNGNNASPEVTVKRYIK